MESSAKTKGFHSTPSNYSSFAVAPQCSPIWYNLHSYIIYQRGESLKKGLYFTHMYPFLAIHAKGGETISPKQKDHTTTNFKRTAPPPISKICSLSICIKEVFFKDFQIGILFFI
jgi:hypothetical protein